MKQKNLFLKIYIPFVIIAIITLIVLQILGSKKRIGYLTDFNLNIERTLELNNLNDIKENFTIDNKLDEESIKNYLLTNESITNYVHHFRIRYYDKVFRNSDIYGVYLITNNLPEYITEIKMNELGSPFGIFTSTKIIEKEKIDNINYILRLKIIFVSILIFVIYFLLIFFEFAIADLLKLFKIFLNKLKSINIKNYSIILILFLCFLIMPNIIYKIFYERFDHINYENRTLASKPILVSTNINEYPKNYEEYFNDYLPFKTELVKLKNLSDIFVFKNVFDSRALLGKNKWLIDKYRNLNQKYMGIERYYFTESELETAKSNLIHFRDELKKKNIDFILMVCPDKQSIYFEYMPNYIKRKSTKNDTDIFVEYIRNNTDIKVIYPKDELLKYKDKYQLYYKYDTHWNNLGAYIGYAELMKSLNIYVDNIDDVNIKSLNGNERFNFDIHHYNDMANMLSLSRLKYYNDDKTYILSNYITKNYETNYYISFLNFSYNSKSYNNENNIMIIRDSYAMNMLDYIATGFIQSEFIHMDIFKNKNITEYKPNIVVFQSVERNLKDRILNVMPNYKIEEINEE